MISRAEPSPLGPGSTPTRHIFPSPGFLHYWTEGHGPVLLKKLDSVPTREQIDAEAPKLLEFDALGDAVVRDVYQAMGFKAAGELMEKVLRQGIDAAPDAPASLKTMITAAEATPDWVDWDKIELGANFCQRSGSFGLIVLRNYCLMGGYESSAINKPLIATGALKKGAAKRMAETVEFWVCATGSGALRPHAIGYLAAIKVRLMHAYARVAVRESGLWDSHTWGEPINQWDMVATNLGFSLAYLDGLRSLGFRPDDAEVEGLLHFWKYIGHLLGIPPHYLPDTEVQAIRTLYHWTITQPPADDDTKALAHALSVEPLTSKYLPFMWMKRMLCKTHLAYNHFFLGERSCTTMGLPPTRIPWYPKMARSFQSTVQALVHSSPRIRRLTIRMGRRAQLSIMNRFLGRPATAETE